MSTPSTLEVFSGETFYPGGIDGSEVVGDIQLMSGGDVGGDDSFSGASDSSSGYTAYGDAFVMLDSAVGGNDYFSGGDGVYSGAFAPSVASDVTSLVSFFFSGGVEYAGDAGEMHDRSVGGDDTMQGGINSSNFFAGDALFAAFDRVVGGNDSLVGGGAEDGYASNMILGDAGQFGYSGGGGIRSAGTGSSRESGSVTGGSDYIEGGGASADLVSTGNGNFLVGDGYAIYGKSTGGADEIHGGSAVAIGDPIVGFDANVLNFIVGDGFQMQGTSTGGADALYGGDAQSDGGDAYAINFMAGDSMGMFGQAHAGNDMLIGGNVQGPQVGALAGYGAATLNLMAGDTFYSEGAVKFGDDELQGGVGSGDGYALNAMYGDSGDTNFLTSSLDVSATFDHVSASDTRGGRGPTYGNDTLVGGQVQAQNFLVGDAQEISGKGSKGGDDLLIAGAWSTENTLVGDAITMAAGTKGGNDVLISGEGNDLMWGDGQSFTLGGGGRGGSDIFVFGPANGVDTINDFRARDRDKIDLSLFGDDPDFRNFKAFAASERMEQTDGGVVLHLDQVPQRVQVDNFVEVNTVLIVGVTLAQLTSSSFIF